MKCHICGHEIPQGRKYCPGCGRVVRTNNDNIKTQNNVSSDTMKFVTPTPQQDKTKVYRPAASKTSTPAQQTIHIPDIFSSDPNAPEYKDPHSYDRATADILEYDRMFVSRNGKDNNVDDGTKRFEPIINNNRDNSRHIYIEQEPEIDESYDNDDDTTYSNDNKIQPAKQKSGPRLNINGKVLFICIAVILGIAICVTGVYQIGKQFGFWANEETSASIEEDPTDDKKLPSSKEPKTDEDANDDASEYKTGVYTVKSEQKNIFVYKSATDQRITATIPNETVIEITEIKGEMGKTTYNTYTGWVELAELKYTPDEEPEEENTTKAEDTSDESSDFPTTPGTYTVTLNGSTALNVRDSNSTQGNIIATLSDGTEVTVEEVKSSWGKITVDGEEGWVYMEYLK